MFVAMVSPIYFSKNCAVNVIAFQSCTEALMVRFFVELESLLLTCMMLKNVSSVLMVVWLNCKNALLLLYIVGIKKTFDENIYSNTIFQRWMIFIQNKL